MAPPDLASVADFFDISALVPMAVFLIWWVLGD